MVDKLAGDAVVASEERHFQRVQRQAGPQVVRNLPAHDLAGEQVGDERGADEPAGHGHIGDVRNPAAVRRGRGEVPFQQVSRPLPARIRHRRPRLLPLGRYPGNAQLAHQPLHCAPGGFDTLTAQLQPYFPGPVYPAALPAVSPYAHDLFFQPLIPGLAR
jgi:hypothetical protein